MTPALTARSGSTFVPAFTRIDWPLFGKVIVLISSLPAGDYIAWWGNTGQVRVSVAEGSVLVCLVSAASGTDIRLFVSEASNPLFNEQLALASLEFTV